MTERALPAAGARTLGRPTAVTRPEAVARPARPVARTKEAILSTPARAGMLIGASAAVYAVTLAGVATLQAQSDAETMANRAPYVAAIADAKAANDAVEAALLKADAEARALAADYGTTGGDVTAYQARLDALTLLVADVQGSAAALPARIKLPSVSMHGSVGSARAGTSRSAPRTTSTTRASGG